MVRSSFFDDKGKKKGAWSVEEDNKLRSFIQTYGIRKWHDIPKYAGLARCEKSCRLRWMNYLCPGVRRGNYTQQEECLLIKLHQKLGNKWADIAREFPGRTDNDIKNYWHAHIKKRYTKQKHINHDHNSNGLELKDQLHAKPSSRSEKSMERPPILESSQLAIRSSSDQISSMSELRSCNGDDHKHHPPSNDINIGSFHLDDLEELIQLELSTFDTQYTECNDIYSIFDHPR